MNGSHQQEEVCSQETEFAGPALSKQRKIIHFASGETLEEEDSGEEEERSANAPPFGEPTERPRFSFKNMAILVGRISLLTCDFLGERLAGALGLNAAKYQYAIDQHRSDRKKPSSRATEELVEGRGEAVHLSHRLDGSHYGATGDADSRGSSDEKHMPGKEGYKNRSYQADEDFFK